MSSVSFENWLFGKWGFIERSLAAWLKDVVYPEGAFCGACGKASDGATLCASCRRQLREDGFVFSWERNDPEPGFPVWSLRPHDGIHRQLILRLKYNAEARIAPVLADLVLPLPEDVFFPPDTVVTWVTMPESRRRDRGIDHGRLLAEAFANRLDLPFRQLLLRRDNREKRQVSLSGEDRIANLRGAFRAKEKIAFPVLLIDDVRTTGTTLRRCAAALREGGATQISAITVTCRK